MLQRMTSRVQGFLLLMFRVMYPYFLRSGPCFIPWEEIASSRVRSNMKARQVTVASLKLCTAVRKQYPYDNCNFTCSITAPFENCSTISSGFGRLAQPVLLLFLAMTIIVPGVYEEPYEESGQQFNSDLYASAMFRVFGIHKMAWWLGNEKTWEFPSCKNILCRGNGSRA